jgi:putative transposase
VNRTLNGQKDLPGMWIAQTEGAKFWLSVLTELQNRGVKDIFIACVDGLTGLPEAIETVYPQTRVQLCMVHLVRNSLRYVSYKHMKAVATDLKAIYSASAEAEAEFNLELFAKPSDVISTRALATNVSEVAQEPLNWSFFQQFSW